MYILFFFLRLTARDPVLSIIFNLEDNNSIEGGRKRVSNSKLCELMKLHRKQKRMCRRGRGVAQSLVEAMHISARECQLQFVNERWNCSLAEPYRLNILRKGLYDNWFIYICISVKFDTWFWVYFKCYITVSSSLTTETSRRYFISLYHPSPQRR